MLTAKQARAITEQSRTAPEEDKWKLLFIQIEATAARGCSILDCQGMMLPENFKPEELKALMGALGYEWTDRSFGHFTISWHPENHT